ncbi:MAG: 16S rRNA (cytosine(1402)-N(4))-methyltransferase RsmH [Patescibacteria group bacterium]|nr:16S rRNA (cytosine(1402)-N(4))-methyltransferase RsmH [Patescibacteria group bacterium]MDE1944009.1 16S rRNA (cytosine(1402)-N(4))-methyltransferase RsmH [Patescibacteria group bacterium]MDE1945155.1 16S rRNA (cytosine(1402)-N(4))-methyltransferase RsmH [Patescibacteria group bacterium]MDE2057995.1 16S rRNA (cytosine(1402)-N(4))-methyltransferase RsmH [Patescibacteria group bacterium]
MTESLHEPVLLEEALAALAIRPGDTVLDATLGGAGHFSRILAALGTSVDGERGVVIGIDADPAAVERAREAYALDRRPERPAAHLVNDNFRNLARVLDRLGVGRVDAALFDLGWSGYQLAALKGFSFSRADEPLLMTYGEGEGGETAAGIVNSASAEELTRILREYGEERFAREIAREIVRTREKARILTVGDLVGAVERATPAWYRRQRTHAATKTFQALRMAANDELGALAEGLAAALAALAPGGRLAVITFHSIEDRAVKRFLREAEAAGAGESASKKPVAPTRAEVAKNRRARSAKLRIFIKHSSVSAIAAAPASAFSYV